MAGGIGVQVPPGVLEQMGEVAIMVNLFSIYLDFVPLFIVTCSSDLKRVSKFFSTKSFTASATMNFMLLCYALFEVENKEQHRDVVFVSLVGFVTATVFAILLLAHRVVTENCWYWRNVMFLILFCFHTGSMLVLCGIFADYQSTGPLINWLGTCAVVLLNGFTIFPVLTGKAFPDDDTMYYTWIMSIMNTADALYFVIYAVFLRSFGSFLSVVSLLNLTGGVVLLLALTVRALHRGLLNGLLKVEEWCQGCAARCGGFFRLIGFIFGGFFRLIGFIFSFHESND